MATQTLTSAPKIAGKGKPVKIAKGQVDSVRPKADAVKIVTAKPARTRKPKPLPPRGEEQLAAALAADLANPPARKRPEPTRVLANPEGTGELQRDAKPPEPTGKLPDPPAGPVITLTACPPMAANGSGRIAHEAADDARAGNDRSLSAVIPAERAKDLLYIPDFLRRLKGERAALPAVLEEHRRWIMPAARCAKAAKKSARLAQGSKSNRIADLCRRENGASMAEVQKAIGRDSAIHIRRHVEKAGLVYSAEKVGSEMRYFAKPKN